jgi:2-oxoglutarate ferredoxin oxidoreductase subunit alpha
LPIPEKVMLERDLNILIGGEAGQGLVTIGELLARSLVRSGYSIVVTQSYQSRIRGGHNTFAIRVSPDSIAAPRESVDLLVALDVQTVVLHEGELTAHGLVVSDTVCPARHHPCLSVPYRELADRRFANIVALGVAGVLLGLDQELVARTLDDLFGKKHPEVTEQNERVLAETWRWCSAQEKNFPRLPAVSERAQRLFMNGNEAVALGALAAGVKFCSFYPMTPATGIPLTLVAQAKAMGLVVEQAEDEIAAINMAIGASFAGAPSMVATSGGGFALMTEGVSLAGMTETPVVIVVGQRPGPATGLPTRTEQGDLEFVLHAGHGEFPRAIFAPGTPEDGFRLIRKAFDLAARFQGPIFFLTDQFFADSYRAVAPFDVEALPPVASGIEKDAAVLPYRRYAITESGISPRLLPGVTRHLVVVDSDEHTEDGHITEDLTVRKAMMEKRLRKGRELKAEVVPPELAGDGKPDLLLVCWGSAKGAVDEAAAKLRAGGARVATLHFSQVWPLVPEQFLPHLEQAREVVGVESNAFGQFARLIRRETGFAIQRQVLRYDGLPMTPEYILRELGG